MSAAALLAAGSLLLAPPAALPPQLALAPTAIADCSAAPLPRADPAAAFAIAREGWTGADGTLSTPLPDGRIAWAFGDTFVGGLRPDGTRDPSSPLIRNALVVQDGHCLTTLVGGTAAAPRSLVDTGAPGEWLWPGQPFVEDGALRVPFARIAATGTGRFDWRFAGSELATFSLDSLRLEDVRDLAAGDRVAWGAAVVADAGFTYVFGVEDDAALKAVHVARAQEGRVADGPWEYWDGAAWSADPAASVAVLAGVSDQLSIVRDGAGWALVSQRPLFSPEVAAWRAPAPQGPWGGGATIATLPVPPGALSYNAVLHPELGTDGGGLVLSSNLTPADPAALLTAPQLYRPVFVRVAIPPAL